MSDLLSFSGKVAIVTGGTQGLGAAVARLLAERGLSGLVTCGRNDKKGKAVSDQIDSQSQCTCRFVTADLSRVEDCRNVVATAVSEFGRIDLLVNCAAVTDRGTLLDTSDELFDRIYAINVRAPFVLMQDSVKCMLRKSVRGAIVNIGSMSAFSGQPFLAAYCTSKGALATLTRNSAFALLRDHIRVNQLNIGWMATEGEDRIQKTFHGASDGWLDQAGRTLPYGRLVDPKEVARAVAFLGSGESGLMSGAVINFDQSVWGSFAKDAPTPAEPLSSAL